MEKSIKHLEGAVSELLAVTGQLTRRLRAVSNTRELTWSQVAIMARLEEMGAMTTADLARAEAVKPQSMGASLTILEAEKLIERRSHPTDGRQILYTLTKEGQLVRSKISLAKRDWLLNAVNQLSATEQKTLVDAVDIIRRLANL